MPHFARLFFIACLWTAKARDKGLLGVTLRYPYEVRKEADYFDDIEDEKLPKDMLDLAKHIVDSKKAGWKPEHFEDQYEDALKELLKNPRHLSRTAEMLGKDGAAH